MSNLSDWNQAVNNLHQICQETFGIPVSYIPSVRERPELGGKAIGITGIFDDSQETMDTINKGGSMEAVIPYPTLELNLEDLGIRPMEGDEMVISNTTYRILDIHLDGHGTALLFLNQERDL